MKILASFMSLVLLAGCGGSGGTTTSSGSNVATVDTSQPSGPSAPVAAEAKRIGGDIGALLGRVSNGVAYEIYPGAFRGADGTLADNAGNDLDKALLLHDLIAAAVPAASLRYASCTLTSQQGDHLIAAAKAAYRAPDLAARIKAISAAHLANADANTMLQRVAGMWTGLIAQQHDESSRLLAVLQNAKAPLVTVTAGDLHPIVASHTWVQEQNNGTWIDLDPTLPNAKSGARLCDVASTATALPDASYDTVAARVRVELRTNGVLDDRPSVSGAWRTAALSAGSLTFAFGEPSELMPSSASSAPAPSGTVAYTPVLRANQTVTAGAPLLFPAPALGPSTGSATSSAASKAAALFGTSPPDTPSPAASAAAIPDVVGVWLQVTVTAPGVSPEVVETPIFDRVGFADRVAGRAASATLSPLDDGAGHYLPIAAVWNVAMSAGTAVAGAGGLHPVDLNATDTPSIISDLGAAQRSYYANRRAFFAATPSAPAIVNARPGISLLAIVWHPQTALATAPTPGLLMDVADDHALPDGAPPDGGVAWGVASMLAERVATNARGIYSAVALGKPTASAGSRDVLAVFDAARDANVSTALVRTQDDIGSGVSADAKARLAASLAGGVAYAPVATVKVGDVDEFGWWSVGSDGSIRDEMQSGRHSELGGEAVIDENVAVRAAPSARRTGMVVRCVVIIVAAFGFLAEPGGETGNQLAEAARAAQEEGEIEQEIENVSKGGDCG